MSVAPKHFGVRVSYEADDFEDLGEDIYEDKYEGTMEVYKVRWFMTKGEDLLRSRKIKHKFAQNFSPNPSRSKLQVENTLYEYALERAVKYPREGTKRV
jgi:hypothetical protein